MSLSNVVRLRPVSCELFRGQAVEFPDPDLPIRHGQQMMNEGTIFGFEGDDVVLVVLQDEPGAVRRVPRLSVTPSPGP